MKRNAPSRPMLHLATDGRIVGKALDYGAGRGYDAETYDMEKYDPHFQPDMPDGLFDTITLNYVLNVIESEEERLRVLSDIQKRLTRGGKAYLTVRNDKRALRGTTSKGTWQGHIILKLPVVYSCSGYVTYQLEKSDYIGPSIMEVRIYD